MNLRHLIIDELRNRTVSDVLNEIADAFETVGIHLGIAAVKRGNPTPLIVSRLQKTDLAGALLHGIGSWFTLKGQPKMRRVRGQPPAPNVRRPKTEEPK